ncbi:unnamed protein product [Plutella xylostella]|uniref:(diamondback moth) hypothetical protein n=1 Tax=Plutella xylostella TaxID=51655 RepID=A0A8S4EUU1_PLUXY|nr:unnamed protein product [Plutella xylostella]
MENRCVCPLPHGGVIGRQEEEVSHCAAARELIGLFAREPPHQDYIQEGVSHCAAAGELIVSGPGEEDYIQEGVSHCNPQGKRKRGRHKQNWRCSIDAEMTWSEVSGFVYVTSVLSSLQGKLSGDAAMSRDMLQLLHVVFYTISTAMRFEPANAKFFHHERVLASLRGRLRGDAAMSRDMLQLLHVVFYTISTAMRFEPAQRQVLSS